MLNDYFVECVLLLACEILTYQTMWVIIYNNDNSGSMFKISLVLQRSL